MLPHIAPASSPLSGINNQPWHKAKADCLWSGSRESNPGRTVPNRVHYHYATPRGSECRRLLRKEIIEQLIKVYFYSMLNYFFQQALLAAAYDRMTRGCKLCLLVLSATDPATCAAKVRTIYHLHKKMRAYFSTSSNTSVSDSFHVTKGW